MSMMTILISLTSSLLVLCDALHSALTMQKQLDVGRLWYLAG